MRGTGARGRETHTRTHMHTRTHTLRPHIRGNHGTPPPPSSRTASTRRAHPHSYCTPRGPWHARSHAARTLDCDCGCRWGCGSETGTAQTVRPPAAGCGYGCDHGATGWRCADGRHPGWLRGRTRRAPGPRPPDPRPRLQTRTHHHLRTHHHRFRSHHAGPAPGHRSRGPGHGHGHGPDPDPRRGHRIHPHHHSHRHRSRHHHHRCRRRRNRPGHRSRSWCPLVQLQTRLRRTCWQCWPCRTRWH
jgi:hypothetical protein